MRNFVRESWKKTIKKGSRQFTQNIKRNKYIFRKKKVDEESINVEEKENESESESETSVDNNIDLKVKEQLQKKPT